MTLSIRLNEYREFHAPPHDLAAQARVIDAGLYCWSAVRRHRLPAVADFYGWRHQRRWGVILRAARQFGHVDPERLLWVLDRRPVEPGKPSTIQLVDFSEVDGDRGRVTEDLAVIREMAERRALIDAAQRIAERAWNVRRPFSLDDAAGILLGVAREGAASWQQVA